MVNHTSNKWLAKRLRNIVWFLSDNIYVTISYNYVTHTACAVKCNDNNIT